MANEAVRLVDSQQYQRGEQFHEGLAIRINDANAVLLSRLETVVEICRGGRVIHVGCVDHLPLLEEKLRDGTWLHSRLMETTKRCVGIDINAAGIARLRSLGFNEVYDLDVQSGNTAFLADSEWDFIVLGEMIEHLDDPTAFLSSVYKKFRSHTKHLVLTTPNAFYVNNFRNALKHVEMVNTDHRIWFTPFTLAKAITRAGFGSVEIRYAHGTQRPRSLFKRWIFRKFPALSMNLVAVAKF